jgi:dethiobiotin synthetase
MSAGLFITATDTCAGKTLVGCGLLSALSANGFATAGFKPVAAGADATHEGLRNEDAVMLRRFSSVTLSYDDVNPITLADAIAPHIAAESIGQEISLQMLVERHRRLTAKADVVICEGAGGWLVPLSHSEYMSDLAVKIGHPVVLVVGMRLGCLNHALLTAESVRARGANLAAWVANRIDPDMPAFEENLKSLEARLKVPCAGVVPWLHKIPADERVGRAGAALDLAPVIRAFARA